MSWQPFNHSWQAPASSAAFQAPRAAWGQGGRSDWWQGLPPRAGVEQHRYLPTARPQQARAGAYDPYASYRMVNPAAFSPYVPTGNSANLRIGDKTSILSQTGPSMLVLDNSRFKEIARKFPNATMRDGSSIADMTLEKLRDMEPESFDKIVNAQTAKVNHLHGNWQAIDQAEQRGHAGMIKHSALRTAGYIEGPRSQPTIVGGQQAVPQIAWSKQQFNGFAPVLRQPRLQLQ